MNQKVIILERGDAWLTRSSIEDIAVFSSEDEFEKFASELLKRNIISEWGYKCLTGHYGESQRQCDDVRQQMLNVRIEKLNLTVDDTDMV